MKHSSSGEKLIITLNHFFSYKITLTKLNVSKLLEHIQLCHTRMLPLSQTRSTCIVSLPDNATGYAGCHFLGHTSLHFT